MSLRTGWEYRHDPAMGWLRWNVTLTESEMEEMDREQIDMLRDGFWLVQQALAGHTDGPLMLPRLRISVR